MAALKLGELLVKQAKLRPEQLRQGLALQQRLGGRLGTNLLEAGLMREEALLSVLGEQRATRTASHADLAHIPPEVLRQLPAKLAGRYQLVPYRLQGKTLFVASMDIGDALIEDEIRMLTGTMVRTTLALELRVREALRRYYRVPCQDRVLVLARRLAGGGAIEPARREAPEPPKVATPPPPVVRPRPAPKPAAKPRPKPTSNDSQVVFIELDAEDEAALRVGRSAPPTGEAEGAGPPTASGQVSATAALGPLPDLEIPELEQALEGGSSDVEGAGAGGPKPASGAIAGLPMEIPEPDLRDPELSIEHRLDLAAAALQEAEIRDEIADVLLGFCAPYLARRMLLIHRQDRIVGWRGEGDRVRHEAVRAITIDHKEPSVFLSVNPPDGFWLGPLPPLEPNQRLVAGLGGEVPKGCLVLPVVLRSKVVCYLYGDNRQRGVAGAPMAELRRLVAKAGIAFEVYILKNKLRLM